MDMRLPGAGGRAKAPRTPRFFGPVLFALIGAWAGIAVITVPTLAVVSPTVEFVFPYGIASPASVPLSTNCHGEPQLTVGGSIDCTVSFSCSPSSSVLWLLNVSSSPTILLIVTPQLPPTIPCAPGLAQTLQIQGNLGHTGSITVMINAEITVYLR